MRQVFFKWLLCSSMVVGAGLTVGCGAGGAGSEGAVAVSSGTTTATTTPSRAVAVVVQGGLPAARTSTRRRPGSTASSVLGTRSANGEDRRDR